MKTIIVISILFLVLTVPNFSQSGSINNTLGSEGSFVIKDGLTTFLNLDQADGYLNLSKSLNLLETSGAAVGVIYKGANRFIHNYTPPIANGLNTFVGINSGNFTMSASNATQASYNTAVGYSTLKNLTTGFSNSAFGYSTLQNLTTGYANSAFGGSALFSNTTGYDNSAFGISALIYNTTGNYNSAFGGNALALNETGGHNSAFGYSALVSNTTGGENSAFGSSALSSNTTGYNNAAFGNDVLSSNTTARYNSAFGTYALPANTTGEQNSAFGNIALYSNITGYANSAFGFAALYFNTTAYKNSAFGYRALYNADGNTNSAFGYDAGTNLTSGSNNTIIGYNAQPSSATVSNEIVLGDAFITTLRCNTQSISSLSDGRDKKNIKYLPLGLDFLMKIKPRLFNWDRREWYEDGISDGSKMDKTPTAGFIAQELDSVQINTGAKWLNLVLKTNPERIEATPGNLFPIVVKAIQDLKFENDALAEENTKLQNELEILRSSIAGIVKAEVKAAFLRAVENKGSAVEVSLLGSTD